MTKAATLLAAGALILAGGLTAAAQTQNAPPPGQEPPPVADAGAGPQGKCISESDDYKMSGKQPTFVIALENKCEQRMRCKVFVTVTSAKGAAEGHTTMILGPTSSGAAAKKSYTLKVKMMGGMSQSSRECAAL